MVDGNTILSAETFIYGNEQRPFAVNVRTMFKMCDSEIAAETETEEVCAHDRSGTGKHTTADTNAATPLILIQDSFFESTC